MSDYRIPCRRCLLDGVSREGIEQKITEYLSSLSEEEQTPSALYTERLAVCESCASLENGLCRECGCFVLYRAGKAQASCPLSRWR